MALIRSNIYSSALTTAAAMDLIIPLEANEKEIYPVLWLLPPLGKDQSAWHRNTRIEQLAEKYGIIAAMPGIGLSYGQDMHYGLKYSLMITKELPSMVKDYYPVDLSRQYIAGAREGGYAAFQAALLNPGQYRAALSMSYGCVTDENFEGDRANEAENAFGTAETSRLKGTDKCLETLLNENSGETMVLSYGSQDRSVHAAENLGNILRAMKKEVYRQEGTMSWSCWEAEIERFIKEKIQEIR